MPPRFMLLMSSGSKTKEHRYTCLSEAKASNSQRMWAEVSSSSPHLRHSGLSDSPIRWRCLLRVLRPVRRPALDCVLLKDTNLALAPRQGPEISSRDCLWVSPIPRHHTQCCLTNQHLILLCISCLESPKAGWGPSNSRVEPSLASSSAVSFPCTPACPGTQYSPTACRVEINFTSLLSYAELNTADILEIKFGTTSEHFERWMENAWELSHVPSEKGVSAVHMCHAWERPKIPFRDNHWWWDMGWWVWCRNQATVSVVESIMSMSQKGKTSLLKCEEQAHWLFEDHRDVRYEFVPQRLTVS